MKPTFLCRHCQSKCQKNPRNKHQKYCSSTACQNARKRLHEKQTLSTPKGQASKKIRNQKWRAKYPAHEYQKHYRITHPEYENHNRDEQRKRNKKRHFICEPKIVKTDALSLQPFDGNTYVAFKVKSGKIVKTDTLFLQMQAQLGIDPVFASNSS
jgi:transposase